jgi:hypothetical protein
MGSNLQRFPEFKGPHGKKLAKALAARAKGIAEAGPDQVTAVECIRRVHDFDPEDAWTTEIAQYL